MPIHAAAERSEFEPPPQPGFLRALALALLAHFLLAVMLTAGLKWKRDSQDMAAEAELWSSLPQQAAPQEVAAPPTPPAPVVKEQPPPEPPKPREADIAIEQEKKRQQAEAARRQEELEREREKQRKLAAQKKAEQEAKRQEQQKLAAENRRKEESAKKKKEEQESRRVAQLREENLRRIQGMAGATGSPSAQGSAQQSSGPSASWAGRVRARVKPNIVFTDDVAGNPEARIEVRLAPDGTIVSKRLVKSSGLRAWDEAVMRALDKTETLPRDTDGRVPSPVELVFRPKD